MEQLGAHTITVLRAPLVEDDYGNSEPDWSAATSHDVSGCSVQPAQGTEATVGRETIVLRWQVYAPAGTDVTATDRVTYAGETYDVDGVQAWDFPPLGHVVITMHRGDS